MIRHRATLLGLVAAIPSAACVPTRWEPLECGPVARARPALVRTAGAPAGELAGAVTLGHPGGRPLERAGVWLTGPWTDSTVADSAGRFHFAALPPGRYILQARYLGVSPRTDTIDLGATTGETIVLPLAGPYPDECPNVLVPQRR